MKKLSELLIYTVHLVLTTEQATRGALRIKVFLEICVRVSF